MVRRTQTVCGPGRTPPCPTLVPLRRCANEGSITPCPRLNNKKKKKKTHPETRRGNRNGLKTPSSLTDKHGEVGGKKEREREMGINEEMTTDGRYGKSLAAVHEKDSWQRHPSQTWRHKRHDGSNLQRHKERERGRRRERDDEVWRRGGLWR